MAKTIEEFESKLLPVYLDIATEAVILFDPEDYLKRKFALIRSILEKERLKREKRHNSWIWVWEKPRGRNWELEWR